MISSNTEKGVWNSPFRGTPHEARVMCTSLIVFCSSILTAAFGALLKLAMLLYVGASMLVAALALIVYAWLIVFIFPSPVFKRLAPRMARRIAIVIRSKDPIQLIHLYINRKFLNRAFAHFCWIGFAKFLFFVACGWILVDVLHFSGWLSSIITTPIAVAVNWLALKYFILPDSHTQGE
jgi:putative flippase GtrA